MRRSIPFRLAVTLAVGALLASVPIASATNLSDVTIAPVTGADQLPTGATADWTTLRGPVVELAPYSNPDVLPEGTVISFTLPDGFAWDPMATTEPTVAPSAGMPAGICDLSPGPLVYSAATVSVTLSGTHDIGCSIAFDALRVRAIEGATPPRGDITATWTVPGLGSATASAGSLAVAVVPDDTTPIVPATRDTGFDPGPILVILVIVVVIAGAVAIVWRRPTSPA